MIQNDLPYPVGTVKLTFLSPDDYWTLNSKMFKSNDEAILYAIENNKKDWLIMKLVATDGNNYQWELQPNGAYRSYTTSMKIKDNFVLKMVLMALMLYGAYSLLTLGFKKLK